MNKHSYDDHFVTYGPDSFGGEDYPSRVDSLNPIVSPEDEKAIQEIYKNNPQLQDSKFRIENTKYFKPGQDLFDDKDAWIQTYSGRRFTPTNPVVDAIVIQDIAHSLSMQCRFSGHVKRFYSVAQHSILVSYICDSSDALWGLLHDASEAYLVDVPRPLKHSGKFDAYIEFETKMQRAICQRFGLSEEEPLSVKKADKLLLSTEARDLMSPLREDWRQAIDPLPFKIDPLPSQAAKDLFMKRFFELTGCSNHYAHYLEYEYKS